MKRLASLAVITVMTAGLLSGSPTASAEPYDNPSVPKVDPDLPELTLRVTITDQEVTPDGDPLGKEVTKTYRVPGDEPFTSADAARIDARRAAAGRAVEGWEGVTSSHGCHRQGAQFTAESTISGEDLFFYKVGQRVCHNRKVARVKKKKEWSSHTVLSGNTIRFAGYEHKKRGYYLTKLAPVGKRNQRNAHFINRRARFENYAGDRRIGIYYPTGYTWGYWNGKWRYRICGTGC